MAAKEKGGSRLGLQLEAINSGNAMGYREQLQIPTPRGFQAILCIRTIAFTPVGRKSCQKQFCTSLVEQRRKNTITVLFL